MITELVALVSLLSVVSCAHDCTIDGQFPNPDDKTSYLECIAGIEYFRRCARAQDGLQYMVFDGRQCVEPQAVTTNFVCPQPSGLFRYLGDDRHYYECVDNKPLLKQCPDSTIFDGLVCSQPTGPMTSGEFTRPEAFTCPRSSGVFANPPDRYRYTYYECHNFVATKRNCPSYTIYREGQYHQDRMVFDGQSCVRPNRDGEFVDDRKPVYEDRPSGGFVDNRVPTRPMRQTEGYRCPATDGLFQVQPNTWYECEAGAAKRVYSCESGLTLDSVTKTCRGIRIQDEEVVVHRPETVPVESSPRVTELGAQDAGRFYPDYYGRRYRRNGRVEFEDQHTGSVIVDTWNEGAWRWDRNLNGQRLPLPQVNDWRAYDYYRSRTGEYDRPVVAVPGEPAVVYRRPPEEYRRPAVDYVYRPEYDRRVRRQDYYRR